MIFIPLGPLMFSPICFMMPLIMRMSPFSIFPLVTVSMVPFLIRRSCPKEKLEKITRLITKMKPIVFFFMALSPLKFPVRDSFCIQLHTPFHDSNCSFYRVVFCCPAESHIHRLSHYCSFYA